MTSTHRTALLLVTGAINLCLADVAHAQWFRYTLSLDCKSEDIRETGSDAYLQVKYLDSERKPLTEPRGPPFPPSPNRPRNGQVWAGTVTDEECRGFGEYAKELNFYTDAEVKYVQITTSGDDALWIDRVQLSRWDIHRRERRPRQQVTWGEDGGNGYCLSTDRSDYKGSWEPFVGNDRKCRPCFEFKVDANKVANQCRDS